MTPMDRSFSDLTDDQLLAAVKRLAATEGRATAAFIRSLMELNARRLYLREGCASLFTYCTQVLHLAEGPAYNRIEARVPPAAFRGFSRGSPTVLSYADRCAVARAAPDPEQSPPRPGGRAALAQDGNRAPGRLAASETGRASGRPEAARAPPRRDGGAARRTRHGGCAGVDGRNRGDRGAGASARGDVLAPERYKIQLTTSRETHDALRRVQALARHTIPTGDLAEIFARALTLLLEDLERVDAPRHRRLVTHERRPTAPGTSLRP